MGVVTTVGQDQFRRTAEARSGKSQEVSEVIKMQVECCRPRSTWKITRS